MQECQWHALVLLCCSGGAEGVAAFACLVLQTAADRSRPQQTAADYHSITLGGTGFSSWSLRRAVSAWIHWESALVIDRGGVARSATAPATPLML